MAFPHYQQTLPGWGTNQFQFGPPPVPSFQPQPSWGGMDFYRAHALTPDPSLFDYAWNRVRDYSSAAGNSLGVGLHEARHWHRRAYGGLGELDLMAPVEIGHAAAYEAYRTWIHNSFIYEPLSGDSERQREGLSGLAVAEAARLLQFSGRAMDNYARMTASEAAAHTASLIFYQSREGDDPYSRSSRRHPSYNDPYAYDDDLVHRRPRSRSRHRHRSHSRPRSSYANQSPSIIQVPGANYSSGGMMPGVPSSGYGGQMGPYGSYGGGYNNVPGYGGGSLPMSIPGHASSYHSSGSVPMGPSTSYGSQGMSLTPGYQHSMPMGVSPSYQNSSVPMVIPMGHSRSRSSSMSFPQGYMGHVGSGAGMAMSSAAPPQTIVIHKSRKHKHRHGHHHRSRSVDPAYHSYSSSAY